MNQQKGSQCAIHVGFIHIDSPLPVVLDIAGIGLD